MTNTQNRHLAVDHRVAGVKIVRFISSDLWGQLDDYPEIEKCGLYQELAVKALDRLAAGEGLVLDLGQLEYLSSAFLGFLLTVRKTVMDRRAWMALCQLRPQHREALEITRTLWLFRVAGSAEEAIQGGFQPDYPNTGTGPLL